MSWSEVPSGGGGGWISIWNQGIDAQKIWNLGIEAQNIWNLATEKISGIWDLGSGGLGIFFWQNKFSQQLYGPKITKHKSILQMDRQTETWRPNTLAITGAWWYNHNHNAPKYARIFQGFRFQKVFSNGLKLNPMELCDCVTHWIIIFIFDPSLTQLDLIIWFSLYLIKVACFETGHIEQLGVSVVVPKCHNYKTNIWMPNFNDYCQLCPCFCQWNTNITCIYTLDSWIWGGIRCLFVSLQITWNSRSPHIRTCFKKNQWTDQGPWPFYFNCLRLYKNSPTHSLWLK